MYQEKPDIFLSVFISITLYLARGKLEWSVTSLITKYTHTYLYLTKPFMCLWFTFAWWPIFHHRSICWNVFQCKQILLFSCKNLFAWEYSFHMLISHEPFFNWNHKLERLVGIDVQISHRFLKYTRNKSAWWRKYLKYSVWNISAISRKFNGNSI